jgi:TonB family protein
MKMRKATFSLIAFLLLSSPVLCAVVQETNQRSQSAATETEQPKNEVERMLEDAKKSGETIISACLENCDDKPVQQGFEPGRALVLVKPNYPMIARAAHAEGQVDVKVIIDLEGNVIAAHAIAGHPLLQATSVTAARGTTFTPAKLDGKPVKVVGIIRYTFSL